MKPCLKVKGSSLLCILDNLSLLMLICKQALELMSSTNVPEIHKCCKAAGLCLVVRCSIQVSLIVQHAIWMILWGHMHELDVRTMHSTCKNSLKY